MLHNIFQHNEFVKVFNANELFMRRLVMNITSTLYRHSTAMQRWGRKRHADVAIKKVGKIHIYVNKKDNCIIQNTFKQLTSSKYYWFVFYVIWKLFWL